MIQSKGIRNPTTASLQNSDQNNQRTGKNLPMNQLSARRYKPVIDRSKIDPTIVKAAEGMEAMFLDHMMSVMRKTVPENELSLENSATKIYRSMLDSEHTKMAARQGGIGLADDIIAYFISRGYNKKEGHEAPMRRKK